MGIILFLGHATIFVPPERLTGQDAQVRVRAMDMMQLNAPAGCEKNQRRYTYTELDDILKGTELNDLMMQEETGLIKIHPGCVILKREHYEVVRQARQLWQKRHPDTRSESCEPLSFLIWFSWWSKIVLYEASMYTCIPVLENR